MSERLNDAYRRVYLHEERRTRQHRARCRVLGLIIVVLTIASVLKAFHTDAGRLPANTKEICVCP